MLPWIIYSLRPKRHLDRFSRFAQLTAQSPPILYNASCAFACGNLDSRLIHSSLGTPESTTQAASRSVQRFFHGSRSRQTDRPRHSVCNNRPTSHRRIYVVAYVPVVLRCGIKIHDVIKLRNIEQKHQGRMQVKGLQATWLVGWLVGV